jgi:predicted PhzF superfamily epimerase YddE/YHI9
VKTIQLQFKDILFLPKKRLVFPFESTFIVCPEVNIESRISFRIRISTKVEELSLACHKTLGAAYVLRELYGRDEIRLFLKVGSINVNCEKRIDKVFAEIVQSGRPFGSLHAAETLSKIYGFKNTDIDSGFNIHTETIRKPLLDPNT